jgi:hypothetical protein
MNKVPDPLSKLSDKEVISEVKRLARVEAKSTADLVVMLAVFDRRKLYLGEGCSSIHAYCTRVLKLSEHAAYNRIEAARAVNRFPVVLERLVDREINLTAITLLSAHLTPDNHLSVLAEARHKSKADVQKIAARLSPRPDVPATIRKLPAPRFVVGEASEPVGEADTSDLATSAASNDGVGSRATASDLAGGLDRTALLGSSGGAKADDTTDVANGGLRQMTTDLANGRQFPNATVGLAKDALDDDGAVLARAANATSGASRMPGIVSPLERAAAATIGTPPHATVAAKANGAGSPASLLDPSRHRPVVVPLAPERFKVQMTIGTETLSKLRRAQDMLRHQVPDGDLSVVFDRALTLLVAELERKKCALVNRPRGRGKAGDRSKTEKGSAVIEACGNRHVDIASGPAKSAAGGRPAGGLKSGNCSLADKSSGSATTRRNKRQPYGPMDAMSSEAALGSGEQPVPATPAEGGKPEVGERGSVRRSRRIPAKVKRDVWQRDQGRCRFVGNEGRCEQTGRLEYHHVVPYAVGGEATAESVQLRCRVHNQHEAAQFFGFDCTRFSKKRVDGGREKPTGSGTSSRPEGSTPDAHGQFLVSGHTGSGTSSRVTDSTRSRTSSLPPTTAG